MCTDDRSSRPAYTWELVLAGRVKIGASIYLEVLYFKFKRMVKCPSIFYNKNNNKGLDKKRGISFPPKPAETIVTSRRWRGREVNAHGTANLGSGLKGI